MATEKDFKIKNGLILNNDNSGARLTRSGNYLKNTTQHGFIQFGPNNTGYAHIDTDRTQFYFSKKLIVDEGVVSSYNEDLILKRASATTNQLTIGTSAATFAGNLVVNGNLTVNGSTVTNSSTNTTIEDALIELGSGNTGANSNDLGLILERGSTGDNAFIGWQEANDRFIVATTTATGASTGALSVNRANMAVAKLIMSSDLEMVQDSIKIKLGGGSDLQLHHDGTDSFMINYTGDLVVRNGATDKDIIFQSDDGSGSETTYFLLDGSTAKTQFNRHLKIIDNMQIQVGTNPDMLLYHDGTDSYIDNNTGDLYIRGQGDDLILRANDDIHIQPQGNDNGISLIGNGGVLIYYDSSQKLATTSGGVSVTGTVDATGTITSSNGTVTNVMSFSDRGIFGTTSNHPVELRANGSQAIRIDTSQRAGFGTSSPEEKIEVAGNIRMQSPISTTTARPAATVATLNSGEIRAKNSDGSDGGLLRLSAGAGTTQNTMSYIDLQGYSTAESQNGKHIIFGTGGTDRMEIDSLGRVYIGTTNNTTVGSPDDFLTVGSTTNNEEVAYNLNVMEGSNNRRAKFFLDDNSGLYGFDTTASSGVPHFVINTATTERFRITNAGNVGIGVTSPEAALDVNGEIYMTTVLVHKGDTDTTAGFHGNDLFRIVTGGTERFEVGNSGIRVNDGGNDVDFTIESNNDANMFFLDGGNDKIGIGTSSPLAKLQVTATGVNPAFFYGSDTWNYPVRIRNTTSGQEQNLDLKQGTGGASILTTGTSLSFQTESTERARFTSTGLGIGTTSPVNKLDVVGTIYSSGGIRIGSSSSGEGIFRYNPGNGSGIAITSGSFNTAGIKMFISHTNDSGNVGIGTTSPGAKLEVNSGTTNTVAIFSSSDDKAFIRIKDDDTDTYLISQGNKFSIGESSSDFDNFKIDITDGNVLAKGSFTTNGTHTDYGVLRVAHPGGADRYSRTSTETGTIKITLPQSWTSTMLRFTVKIYDYTSNESFEVVCAGYTYGTGSSWINTSAYIISDTQSDRNFTVRFGHDGSKCAVYIGETTAQWTYPQITVTDFQAGFNNAQASKWEDGWDVTLESSLGTITATQTANEITSHHRLVRVGGTTVIDTSRNLTNIGTISSGQITTSGNIVMNSSAKIIFGGDDTYNSHLQYTDNGSGDHFFSIKTEHDDTITERARFHAGTGDIGLFGNIGINTNDPDGQGYSFAEDLVILGGNSASDGVGITLRGNGKRYGVIAFGDNADDNAGEIWYDHDNNSMNFRTAGILNATLGSTGNLDVKNGDYKVNDVTVINSSRQLRNITAMRIGSTEIIDSSRNLTNIGTISSGAITTSGAITAGAAAIGNTGEGHAIGHQYKKEYWYDESVGDSDGADTKWTLIQANGNAITSTTTGKVYRVRLVTLGTGTNTGSVWLADNVDAGGWRVKAVSVNATASESSNYPKLEVDSSVPKVSLEHTSAYSVRIFIEEYDTGNNGGMYTIFGTDALITYANNGARIGINKENPAQRLDVNGTIGINGTEIITTARNLTNIGSISSGSINASTNSTLDGVKVSGNNAPVVQITNNQTTSIARMMAQTTYSSIGTASNHPLQLRTNDTTALTINTSQNATFAGTISSGAISSTGQVSGTKGAFTQSTGALPLHTQTPYDFTAKFESTDAGGYIVLEDSTSTNNGNYIGVNGDEFRIYTGGTRALRIASNNTITTDSNLTVSSTAKASTFLVGITSGVGIGVTPGDNNSAELGPGFLNLARDDTATAKQLVFAKNGAVHSYLETSTSAFSIRSDTVIQFLTAAGGSAQNVRTKSLFAGSTYGDVPPAGSVNAVNTYELNGTTVISSSRELQNIDTITITGQASGGTVLGLENNSWVSLKDNGGTLQRVLGASSNTLYVGDVDADFTDMYLRGPATMYIQTNNTTAMTINSSQVVTFANDIVVPDQITHAGDTDTYLQFSDANVFRIVTGGSQQFKVTNTTVEVSNDLLPGSNDTYDLGSTANAWKELHVEDIRFHNASGAVGGIGQYNTGGDIEILSDHNIVFKETDAGTIKAVFGMNGPNFTFGQTTENTSYRVYVNGSIASTADVTAYASDERLKTNIVEIDSAIEKVKQLRGVTFDWQDDVEEKGFEPAAKHETGVIAQEVQKVIPDAVVPAPFDPEYWTVKHEKIIPVLIEAIKEQQKEIEQLKKHSHPAKDMCDMNGYEELVARIEKMEKNYGNN